MDFDKKYWSNGEFKRESGEKYFGYVGISENKGYIFDTEEPLETNNTFTAKINCSDQFFDRTLSHKLELPFKKEDVIFPANDFLYAGTVKTIIERLQENNLYLYRNAIIPNSVLPANETITMFATEDTNTFYFCYIDDDNKIHRAPLNAIFKNGNIYIKEPDELILLGRCSYIINENYSGAITSSVIYEGEKDGLDYSMETAEELYTKFYTIKDKHFSRIPRIEVENNIESGILKRYSFNDKGVSGKTHCDPYFYPQRKYKEYQSVKSIAGTWDEMLSSRTYLKENTEFRDEEAQRWDNFSISPDSAKNVYNIINDISTDIDNESIEDIRKELAYYQSYGNITKLDKTSRYYDLMSGDFKVSSFTPSSIRFPKIYVSQEDINDIWNEFLNQYPKTEVESEEDTAKANFNLQIEKMSFLIQVKDNEFPTLSVSSDGVNFINATTFTYIKTSGNFYHVTYYFDKAPIALDFNNKWWFNYNFDKSFKGVFNTNGEELKYTIHLTYGTKVPGNITDSDEADAINLKNYKKIPAVERKRNFTWVWYEDAAKSKKVVETLPTLTYKYLTESPRWINAEAPQLKYDDPADDTAKLMSFVPNENMTAEDCYVFMANNILSYRNFPHINRESEYYFIPVKGKSLSELDSVEDIHFIENLHYKTKEYNMETFVINNVNGNEVIAKGYKSADESYRELNDENSPNNKKYFDYIPEFKTLTKTESEITPVHDFTQLTNAEMRILKRSEDGKSLDILLFLMFKTKVLITRVKHFINENENFQNDFRIDLRAGVSSDYIEINCVDPLNKNSLLFKNLTDIKLHKNMLYVVDGGLNMAVRYDIEYLTSPEEEHSFNINSIKLLDVLQGDGDITDKVYFNNPFAIAASDDRVYIVDRGNKCVKVYTPSLNYIKILKNGYYATHDIQSVAVNPYPITLEDGTYVNKDSLWVYSVNGNKLYLSIIDNDGVVSYGQIEDIYLLDDKYSWKEEIKNVEFSKCNSNHYYIATTKRVYKIQTSKPYSPLGSLSYFKQRSLLSTMVWGRMHYRWTKLPHIYSSFNNGFAEDNEVTWGYKPPMSSAEVLDNRCFTLAGLDGLDDQFNGDIIFHLGTLYDENKIKQYIKAHNNEFNGNMTFDDIPTAELVPMIKSFSMLFYIEPDSYISSLNNNSINIYDTQIDDVIFEDYINALTFNKMVYAAVHNLLVIKNQLIGYFKAATNLDGLIVYDNMILDDYFAKLNLGNETDYFVHDNEVISIVINRIFENIHNIQQKLLDKMQTKFMASQSYVNNTSRII